MNQPAPALRIPDRRDTYRHIVQDTARFGDTDRFGHINNAAFSTYFETGRIGLLHEIVKTDAMPGHLVVLARITIEYRAEMHWGGMVEIGTAISRIGRSSMHFVQALFQDGACTGVAESVVVLIDAHTRKSAPLLEELRAGLGDWLLAATDP